MLSNLRQFVPQEVCLSCDGCCRFKEETSSWRPKVGPEELALSSKAASKPLAELILGPATVDRNGYIKTVSCHGQHLCSFFKQDDNTCRIYSARPFECQLYPFILSREPEGAPAIFAHINCPHIQATLGTPEFKDYVEYLKEFFTGAPVRDFLKRNPVLIGDYAAYRAELEPLFRIHL